MDEPPRRPPSTSRLDRPIVEEVVPKQGELPSANIVPRKRTPIGMPAPPANPPRDRQSHDDLEHLAEVEKLERDRAKLLVKNQDLEQENKLLREIAPTQIFPPPSLPPSNPQPKPKIETASSLPPSKKYALSQRLMHLATGIGIFVAIAWNAFNSYRSSPEKVEAMQERVAQSDQQRDKAIANTTIERQRTLQALRASHCMFKQIRGAIQRQGLDLQSLPAGGIRVLKLDEDDPNRPKGAPVFITEEQCPPFPELPPDNSRR